MKPWKINKIVFGILLCFIIGCEENFVPKPEGFMRIGLLDQTYNTYQGEIPCEFDLSDNAKLEILSQQGSNVRFNIEYPYYKAKIHMAYSGIENDLATYLEETRKLTYQHHEKANNIEKKKVIIPEHKVYGITYDLSGDVASSAQFFVTDSANHFVRGALYFWAQPNEDSLAPVLQHIREDIDIMINSFQWKDGAN